ncbi:MAG: hypothetical protein JNJ54_31240 [Myxococcaceae bacterium]|nr:hypothetical protein [Myxococcaceae bacterium]
MHPRLLALTLSAAILSCGPTQPTNDFIAQPNEFDDVPVATKCDPMNGSQNCLEPRANVVRIDDESRLNVESGAWDPATSTLTITLKANASPDARIKAGTILYRSRKDRPPLLHKVEELSRSGRTVTLKLARVQLKDAFARGRVRVRIPITDKASLPPQPLTGQPNRLQQPLEIALGPSDCSGNVMDKNIIDTTPPFTQGRVKLDLTKCKFRLRAWVDAILEWDEGFANLDKFELSVGGAIDASMHARLDIIATGGFGEKVRLWEGPELPISVGGILVTINPSLYAGYRLDGEATLVVTHGFDMTDSIEVGFGYSDRLQWYSIDERDSRFTEFGPNVTFDGRVKATAFIEPRLDVKAFAIAGATITLETFGEAKMTSTATVSGGAWSGQLCTKLDVGVTPKIGAVVEVLGVSLLNETMDLGTIRTTLVPNRCAAVNGPVPTNCDPASECCIDGQCGNPTEPGTTVRCKKGMATTNGRFRYRCETVYPENYCTRTADCADMAAVSVDECINNQCQHTWPISEQAAVSRMATASSSALCLAPSCCHSKSDCADGSGMKKKCEKPQGSEPDDPGTCRNR